MARTIAAAAGALLVLLVSIGTAAKAEQVDLQLALIADVSRSVDNDEFRLQREGFASALTDSRVLSAVRSGAVGAIDFTVKRFEASGLTSSRKVIDVSGDGTNNGGRVATFDGYTVACRA